MDVELWQCYTGWPSANLLNHLQSALDAAAWSIADLCLLAPVMLVLGLGLGLAV